VIATKQCQSLISHMTRNVSIIGG